MSPDDWDEFMGVPCDDPAELVGLDYEEPERWLSPLWNLPDAADAAEGPAR